MDFKFTEEQAMIRDTAEAFLAEVSTSAAVRQAMASESGYDPQRLAIVIEPPVRAHHFLERILASVSERRMPQVMSQGDRLGQVFVQAQ